MGCKKFNTLRSWWIRRRPTATAASCFPGNSWCEKMAAGPEWKGASIPPTCAKHPPPSRPACANLHLFKNAEGIVDTVIPAALIGLIGRAPEKHPYLGRVTSLRLNLIPA